MTYSQSQMRCSRIHRIGYNNVIARFYNGQNCPKLLPFLTQKLTRIHHFLIQQSLFRARLVSDCRDFRRSNRAFDNYELLRLPQHRKRRKLKQYKSERWPLEVFRQVFACVNRQSIKRFFLHRVSQSATRFFAYAIDANWIWLGNATRLGNFLFLFFFCQFTAALARICFR